PFTPDDLQVVLPGPDSRAAPRGPAAACDDGPVRSQGGVWDIGQGRGQASATLTRPGAPNRPEPVRLATKLLAEADTQAATIRQQASDQAAATIAAAQQEGVEIRRQAADHAAATIAAAEQEIAERRNSILAMTAELGGMAAYITENLASPPGVLPPTRPRGYAGRAAALPAAPAAAPAAGPGAAAAAAAAAPAALEAGGRSATKPLPSPAARPTRTAKAGATTAAPPRKPRPAAAPGADPGSTAKGRQLSAMRKSMAVLATLIVVGGVTGASEIGLHGLKFFLFRNAGAGAGNSQDLNEDQGPGQANAPGAHHDPVNPPAKGKHHKKGHHGKQQRPKPHQNNGNGGNGNGQGNGGQGNGGQGNNGQGNGNGGQGNGGQGNGGQGNGGQGNGNGN
ncbi:MAG TPA: hypothetical protein VF204_10270, partial [Streptosporangiaceae bacterium]